MAAEARPLGGTTDFDRRGVDHGVLDSRVLEKSLIPEAVAAGLITGDYLGVFGNSGLQFGLKDFDHDRAGAPSKDGNRGDDENRDVARFRGQKKGHYK
jgi:hypothetical protein